MLLDFLFEIPHPAFNAEHEKEKSEPDHCRNDAYHIEGVMFEKIHRVQ